MIHSQGVPWFSVTLLLQDKTMQLKNYCQLELVPDCTRVQSIAVVLDPMLETKEVKCTCM